MNLLIVSILLCSAAFSIAMPPRRIGSVRLLPRQRSWALAVLASIALVVTPSAIGLPGLGKSAATITGSFDDSCRDFSALSSKDISHVVIHHADGRIILDESSVSPDYSIDGGPGDEIDSIDVKSGTTTETFTCTASNGPPSALLERKAGHFDPENSPGTWTSDDCVMPECVYSVPDGTNVPDERAVSFRAIKSTDPNDDIVSWSLDFGDETPPAGGSWITDLPVEVVHEYNIECVCTATLTVIDSAGQSSSDSIVVSIIFFHMND